MRPIHHTKDTVVVIDDLADLAPVTEGPVVSLYLPTEYKRLRTNKERIEMKDLMKEAKHQIDSKYPAQPNNKILVHLDDVINAPDEALWLNAEAGVALFADKDHVFIADLHHKVKPEVFVGDNWELGPLEGDAFQESDYYILAVSTDRFGLIEGKGNYLNHVDIEDEGVAQQFGEIMHDHSDAPALDHHTLMKHLNPYHDYRSRNDVTELESEKFFRYINKVVQDTLLANNKVPVILASLPEHQEKFRKIATIPHLLDRGIEKNPASMTSKELAEAAYHILEDGE